MAKIIVVGQREIKTPTCPQCRKPARSVTERGISCKRCGFIRWSDYKNYLPVGGVPVPDKDVTLGEIMRTQMNVEKKVPVKKKQPTKRAIREGGAGHA